MSRELSNAKVTSRKSWELSECVGDVQNVSGAHKRWCRRSPYPRNSQNALESFLCSQLRRRVSQVSIPRPHCEPVCCILANIMPQSR